MGAGRAQTRFTSSQPRVTIVTPSYNQGAFVERTILSVLRQDYPNIEYIFSDSMSTDDTGDILKRYEGKISKIIREKDKGQADALNKSFAMSTGEIMFYLNTDDVLASPEVVSHAVNHFLSNEDVDVVIGRRYYIDQNGFLTAANPYRPFDGEILRRSCYVPQECTFWTRDIYDRAGAKVSTEFQFCMDYDLWCRFLEQNAVFQTVDKVYGLFRWHQDQKSQAQFDKVGIPEIAKVHEKYIGEVVEFKEQSALFEQHFAGPNRGTHRRAAGLYDQLWRLETHIKRMVLGRAPSDHWVYSNHKA